MDGYFEIKLINFRSWKNATFRLTTGLNLFHGDSGAGKSTICEAIFFCLYGTLKNISSKESKDKEIKVILTRISKLESFEIIRCRPTNLQVSCSNGAIFKFADAQAWLDNYFGSSDVWISSSYLSQGTRHFLMTSSNAEKTKLLQEITFGDTSDINSPDFYINKLKSEGVVLHNGIMQRTQQKQIYDGIAIEFYNKNQRFFVHGLISEEISNIHKERINVVIIEINTLTKLNYQLDMALSLTEKINSLQIINFSKDDQEEITLLEKYLIHLIDKSKLINFNPKVLTVSNDELSNNTFYYNKYISFGYKLGDNLIEWLDKKKEEYEQYLANKDLKKKNDDIIIQNKIKKDINDSNILNFNNCLKTYNNYVIKLKEFNILKDEIKDTFLNVISKIVPLENQEGGLTLSKIDNHLKSFADRLEEDRKLFHLYGRAWSNKQPLSEFLKRKEGEYHSYQKNMIVAEEVSRNNRDKEREYKQKEVIFNDQSIRYNKYITSMNNYTKQKNEIEHIININTPTIINLPGSTDNLTAQYAYETITFITLCLKQLFCPHCNNSLLYENGTLVKGTVTIDEKELYSSLLETSKKEYEKRKKYEVAMIQHKNLKEPEIVEKPIPLEKLILEEEIFPGICPSFNTFVLPSFEFKDYNKIVDYIEKFKIFSSMKKPDEIKEPEVPSLLGYEELIQFKNVPLGLDFFEIPTLLYDDVISITKSKELIPIYNKSLESTFTITMSKEEVIKTLDILNKRKVEYNTYIKNRESIQQQLDLLPKVDLTIKDKLKTLENEKLQLEHYIQCGNITREYKVMLDKIKIITDDILIESNKNNNIARIIKIVSELRSGFIQETIDDINSSLKLILDELFEKPISVMVNTHRLLKNGDEKMEISFEVSYNGIVFDNVKHLSGGECDRISLALLLAFSKIRNTPIIIFDEVMASLDGKTREVTLDIISKWTEGKYSIHICHETIQGSYDNVINI